VTGPTAQTHDETGGGERGREAHWPSQITRLGWWDIISRLRTQISEDRIGLIAAGVTFYLLLALFPGLVAFVSLYGFLADAQTISDQLSYLEGVVPSGGLELIQQQLSNLAAQDGQTLSIGFIAALAAALWSANNGVKSLFQSLNVAYEEQEKRSFLRLNLAAFAFTIGAMVLATVMVFVVGVIPPALALLNLGQLSETILSISRWPILLLVAGLAISVLYRYGPSRTRAKWRWITWGGLLSTLVWVAASAAFSYYLRNFADYNATYGSLGAVIGFLLWTWISCMILIVGAALNAEMEHQTRVDSTVGPPKEIGQRGAYVADHLGKSASSR
jgi:membrane protein